MASTLFREEAVGHHRNRLDGDMLITRSLPLSVVTIILVSITIAVALWCVMGQYSRTEEVDGEIVPAGVISKIFSDRPGQVIWLGVREGDLVRKGQPIISIRLEQALDDGSSPNDERLATVADQARLTNLQISEENQRDSAAKVELHRELSDIERETAEIEHQAQFQESIVKSTKDSFDALTPLVQKGYLSKTDYEQRRQVWLSAAAQYQSAIGGLASLSQRRSQVEGQLAQLPSDHAGKLADLKRSLGDLQQRRLDAEDAKGFTITAPVSGRVTAVQATAGRNTDGHLPLLAIIPEGAQMQAVLFAPSRAVGMAQPGQTVRLRYDAFPSQRFGTFSGRITAISRAILAPSEVDAPVKLSEPIYEITVGLDRQNVVAFGQQLLLSPGMTLKADVVLERRSFVRWLLEPIDAIWSRA